MIIFDETTMFGCFPNNEKYEEYVVRELKNVYETQFNRWTRGMGIMKKDIKIMEECIIDAKNIVKQEMTIAKPEFVIPIAVELFKSRIFDSKLKIEKLK